MMLRGRCKGLALALATAAVVLAALPGDQGVAAAAGDVFYPDGHWDRVTQLTTDNFADVVKTTVDAGKTLFVRWIASQG